MGLKAQHRAYSQRYCKGHYRVTDGSYICGEHSLMHRVVKSLCCTLETNVTLCVNYISILKKEEEINRTKWRVLKDISHIVT